MSNQTLSSLDELTEFFENTPLYTNRSQTPLDFKGYFYFEPMPKPTINFGYGINLTSGASDGQFKKDLASELSSIGVTITEKEERDIKSVTSVTGYSVAQELNSQIPSPYSYSYIRNVADTLTSDYYSDVVSPDFTKDIGHYGLSVSDLPSGALIGLEDLTYRAPGGIYKSSTGNSEVVGLDNALEQKDWAAASFRVGFNPKTIEVNRSVTESVFMLGGTPTVDENQNLVSADFSSVSVSYAEEFLRLASGYNKALKSSQVVEIRALEKQLLSSGHVYVVQPGDPTTLDKLAPKLNLDPSLLNDVNPELPSGKVMPGTFIRTYGQAQNIPDIINGGGVTFKGPNTLVNLSTNTAYAVGVLPSDSEPGTVYVAENGQLLATYPPSDGIYQAYTLFGNVTLLGGTIPGSFPPTPFTVTFTADNGGYTGSESTGEIDVLGGTYTVAAGTPVPGALGIYDGGSLVFDTSADASTTINFADTGTNLIIDQPSIFGTSTPEGYSGPLLENFLKGDVIDLAGLPYVAGMMSWTYSAETGLLQITNGNQTATLNFGVGNIIVDDPFHLAPDSAGGTILTNDAIRCYCRGTMILTDRGEVPVEGLAIGDLVMTHFGGLQPIEWIGRQSFGRRFAKNNRAIVPVRIQAGALADGLPARDLYVTPGHSMFLKDRLVLAKSLINGVTISQDKVPEEIHYYHLEFASHDCVLAEGAWSETYADALGMRSQFHNFTEFYATASDYVAPVWPELCAARPCSGPELEAVLKPVVARAQAMVDLGQLRGWIDGLEDNRFIRGWAQDEESPLLPVLLEIRLDDKVIGTVLACEERADLVAAGIGNGQCSFRFRLPQEIDIEAMGQVTVHRARDGAMLPLSYECREVLNSGAKLPRAA